MIPCVWVFMKRRRTKDYIRVLRELEKNASNFMLKLNPSVIMIDFEIAAKKAFEMNYPQCIVKGSILAKVFSKKYVS